MANYLPYQQRSMLGVLRVGAALLGAACFITCFLEGWTAGAWRSYTGIFQTYFLILSAYGGARETEKWIRPRTRADTFWGEFIVLAWCVLAAMLWLFGLMNWNTIWPPELTTTLEWVLAIYAGSKVSGTLRLQNLPDPDDPGPGPNPLPGPAGPEPAKPLSAVDAAVAQACQSAKRFDSHAIAQATGLTAVQAGGAIGRLMQRGWIQKEGDGSFSWIGPAQVS